MRVRKRKVSLPAKPRSRRPASLYGQRRRRTTLSSLSAPSIPHISVSLDSLMHNERLSGGKRLAGSPLVGLLPLNDVALFFGVYTLEGFIFLSITPIFCTYGMTITRRNRLFCVYYPTAMAVIFGIIGAFDSSHVWTWFITGSFLNSVISILSSRVN